MDEALRDRFVCGLNNEATQKRLLTEKDLTMPKPIETASNLETAEKNTHVMKVSRPSVAGEGSVQLVNSDRSPCRHCGKKGHSPNRCRFKDAVCHTSGKRGHISPVCYSKKRIDSKSQAPSFKPKNRRDMRWVGTVNSNSSDDMTLFTIRNKATPPILIELELNHKKLTMELDTGAAISLISQETMHELFLGIQLKPCDIVLKTYTSQKILVLGKFDVNVTYEDQEKVLTLVVIKGSGPSLIGRNWMTHIRFNWSVIKHTRSSTYHHELDLLLEKYKSVFNDTLGTMKNFTAKLELKDDAKPKFFRPRPVPFALKDSIDQELDRLENDDIITKVRYSDWAAPIVVVPKKDGNLRICGDYKITLNPSLEVDKYPLPKPEDLFATLSGGKVFSKIDLSHAYQQMLLEVDCKKLVKINTHRGLYQYNRLPFGIASAPALFATSTIFLLPVEISYNTSRLWRRYSNVYKKKQSQLKEVSVQF